MRRIRLTFLAATCCMLVALSFIPPAWAQSPPPVNYNTASLGWSWTQGTGGPVAEFRVKCGPASRSYTKTTVLTDPTARVVAVKVAVSTVGVWYCVVTAANPYGESPPSNEVPFDAGVIPDSPSVLNLVP